MKEYFLEIVLLFSLIISACSGAGFEPAPTPTQEPPHDMRNVFPQVEPIYEEFVKDGVRVEFTVKAEDTFLGSNTEVAEGAYATVRFRITDPSTDSPLTDARPAAWMDMHNADTAEDEAACQERVAGYLKGQISNRPLVDLNSFFILAMNSGNSISVIDPLVQVGGITQLYTTLLLESHGEDWVFSPDGNHLYVSLPEAGKVAIANMQSFRVEERVDAGDVPVSLAVNPNGKYLWIGNNSSQKRQSGVTVLDTQTRQIASNLTLGLGHHELAFTPDGKYVLVTSETDHELAIIDAEKFKIMDTVGTDELPVGVTIISDGKQAMVANGGSGSVDVYSLPDLTVQKSISLQPGLTSLSLTPDGRWAFALNPNQDQVYVIETATNELRHTLHIEGAPDQIAFGSETVYIRPLNGTSLATFSLASLDSDSPLEIIEIPYARLPPGQSAEQAISNPIATLPDDRAVLVANAADNMIYYLMEGMLAPVGSYQDQATRPRAVTFVDRSLKQEAPGIYSGKIRVPSGGDYQVALLLDSPRLIHCFNFTAKPGENEISVQSDIKVEFVNPPSQVKRGQPFNLQLRVTDTESNTPVSDLKDLVVLVNQIGGNWSQRYLATPVGNGKYELELKLPQRGKFDILLNLASRGLDMTDLPSINLDVSE